MADGRPDYSPQAFADRSRGVPASDELQRIWNLPRRVLKGSIDPDVLTSFLKTPWGTMRLKESQAYALKEIHDYRGAVVAIVPGGGKTLVGVLGAQLTGAQNAAYFCPASARQQVIAEINLYRTHWKLPRVTVISYGELSTKNGVKLLAEGNYDYFALDEAQAFKSLDSARTKRFLRDLAAREKLGIPVVPMSGSFECREPTECAHIWWHALHERIPYPKDKEELRMWSDAMGSRVREDLRVGLGALRAFKEWLSPEEQAACGDELEMVRRGFGRRVAQTPGVVYSTEAATNVVIKISRADMKVPHVVKEAFARLRSTWETPHGDEITDNFAFAATARQLICGFHYRWIWPDNKPIKEWLEPRRAWHKYVRGIVFDRPDLMMDSKGVVQAACEAYERYHEAKRTGDTETVERLEHVPKLNSPQWRDWKAAEPLYVEQKETKWLSEYMVDDAEQWLTKGLGATAPGIVWVDYLALGDAIRRRGLKYFGGGENEITSWTGPCAASIKAHHVAKNLQAFGASRILNPMSKGDMWEQLIARTDRMGQQRPEIAVEVAQLCIEQVEAFQQAYRDALNQEHHGRPQRLYRAVGKVTAPTIGADETDLWVK